MIRAAFAVVITWLLMATMAFAETRVALIIGNSAYTGVAPLTNPVNDATDLAAALARIGFDVTLANDLDGSGMRAALRNFRDKAEGADMALVYFAGHGIEIDKQNYLIPVDADLKTDSDVMFDTIPLDLLNEAVSGARTLRMVLIDACRNNPFLGQIRVADSGRSLGRGLSPFEPAGGTLVAFAAKGGTVALDGNGRNSPFMKGLLAHVEEPGLDVSLLFRRVRDTVLVETNNRQEPFTYGSLPGREIYLVPPVEVAAVTPAPEPVVVAPAPAPVLGTPEEEFAWSLIGASTDPVQLQKFIRTFPQGVHVDEAFARLDELRQIVVTADPAPEPIVDVAAVAEPVPVAADARHSGRTRAGARRRSRRPSRTSGNARSGSGASDRPNAAHHLAPERAPPRRLQSRTRRRHLGPAQPARRYRLRTGRRHRDRLDRPQRTVA